MSDGREVGGGRGEKEGRKGECMCRGGKDDVIRQRKRKIKIHVLELEVIEI